LGVVGRYWDKFGECGKCSEGVEQKMVCGSDLGSDAGLEECLKRMKRMRRYVVGVDDLKELKALTAFV
jgi:hypothetical protein